MALLGDFNVNLLDYSKHSDISEYYDNLSSSGFRPLILQPTRVTSKSSTLIDNIFINNLTCFSNGGNIVTSISDHYMQFCKLDIFDIDDDKFKVHKSIRNWRIFNKREFSEELSKIDWDNILSAQLDTNQACNKFFNIITRLLDEMAPFRKMTKKEISLKQHPWISHGIVTSMKKRDKLYKEFLLEKNFTVRDEIHTTHKQYRSMIISLIQKSKRKYYFDFSQNTATTYSDHIQRIKIKPRYRWKLKNANWEGFTTMIDNKLKGGKDFRQKNVDKLERILRETMTKAANKHIGRKKVDTTKKAITSPEIKTAIKERNELSKTLPQNRQKWKDACKKVNTLIEEKKSKDWMEFVDTLDRTTDPRKIWSTIQAIDGRTAQRDTNVLEIDGDCYIIDADKFPKTYKRFSQIPTRKEDRKFRKN